MNPGAVDPLAELRDIHLPPEPGFWPPAPGWWLLLLLVLLLIAMLVRAVRRWRRRPMPVRPVLEGALDRARAEFESHRDAHRLLAELSALLRRSARLRDGEAPMGLGGAAWRAYLETHAPDGTGARTWALIAEARYRPRIGALDAEAVIRDCRAWLWQAVPR